MKEDNPLFRKRIKGDNSREIIVCASCRYPFGFVSLTVLALVYI